jgi:Flp pilus assembly protein CpaB
MYKPPKTIKKPIRIRRYNFKQYIPFILLICIFLFFILAIQPHSTSQNTKTNEQDLILLPVPTRSLAKGEKIVAKDWTIMKWTRSKTSAHYVFDIADYEGSVTTTFLPKYMPVLQSVLTKTTDLNAVVEGIPDSMRAITVKVDAESAVEGWARSGNYVDVIVIKESRGGGPEAKVIAENVKILSAGRVAKQNSQYSSTQLPATITILVSQEDALKIKTASSVGKLTFALRGVTDNTPTTTTNMNHNLVFGVKKEPQRVIKGRATGPDGKNYVLTDLDKWEQE